MVGSVFIGEIICYLFTPGKQNNGPPLIPCHVPMIYFNHSGYECVCAVDMFHALAIC